MTGAKNSSGSYGIHLPEILIVPLADKEISGLLVVAGIKRSLIMICILISYGRTRRLLH